MKNTKKRGFTIVELVIVIAVIAILASVLIPTFANVVTKAKESAALQNARNAWTAYLVDHYNAIPAGTICIKSGDFYYEVKDGQFTGKECSIPLTEAGHACWEVENGEIKVNENGAVVTATHKTAGK